MESSTIFVLAPVTGYDFIHNEWLPWFIDTLNIIVTFILSVIFSLYPVTSIVNVWDSCSTSGSGSGYN